MTPPKPRAIALAREIADLAARAGWRQGRHVTETELAKQLGISRTPVRAAMKILVAERAVEARPNQGFFLLKDGAGLKALHLEAPPSAEDLLYGLILRERIANVIPAEVTQAMLAGRYDATRPLLENVLGRLEDDGLLVRGAGRAWRFAETMNDVDSVRASYDFRLLVEPAALMLGPFKARPDMLLSLRERHVELLAEIGDPAVPASIIRQRLMMRTGAVALDADFHGGLASFSGNPFVVAAVRQQIELRRLMELGIYEEASRVMAWCNEHIAVIDALLADDRPAASAALRQHLQRASRDALHGVTETRQRTDDAKAAQPLAPEFR
ncbi:MAG: GntR family transcriptional regulator [Rhizobiales bacterium]|nr:GntR family transcriptional regulator [Hyphomicrobiales bacterium]